MARVSRVLDAMTEGRVVVCLDHQGTSELVVPAGLVTPDSMAFLIRNGSGFVRVALTGAACDDLGPPPVTTRGPLRCAQTVAVDAAEGVSTGISAADRCRTARLLADRDTGPDDLHRPGHTVPVRAWPTDGLTDEPGVVECAVELGRRARTGPAAAMCGLVSPYNPTLMAGHAEALVFAKEHRLETIDVAELFVSPVQGRNAS